MATAREALSASDLRGAFRRFYVWRAPAGRWHARPLPKPTSAEIRHRIMPELSADSLLQLAYKCTWQRSRRNVHRYLTQYAERSVTLESVS